MSSSDVVARVFRLLVQRRHSDGWRFDVSVRTDLTDDSVEIELHAVSTQGLGMTARHLRKTSRRTIRVWEIDARNSDSEICERLRALYLEMHRELFPKPLPVFRIGLRSPKRLQPRAA